MKIEAYLKLVLFMIHISDCKEQHSGNVFLESHFPNFQSKYRKDAAFYDRYIVFIEVTYHNEVNSRPVSYIEKSCTGTLLRENMVITLASCVMYDMQSDPDPGAVKVSGRFTDELEVFRIYINPNFYSKNIYTARAHDCSLLVVERPKQELSFPKIDLSLFDIEEFNKKIYSDDCIMGGYGLEGSSNKETFTLYRLNETGVKTFPRQEDNGLYCLHFANIIPCRADYGTPIICGNTPIMYAMIVPGVTYTSAAYFPNTDTCSYKYITLFSPVSNYQKWVNDILNIGPDNLDWLNDPWMVLLLCCVVFAVMGGLYYGLVELLQRSFDPAEGLQVGVPLRDSDDDSDEEAWYESQWASR